MTASAETMRRLENLAEDGYEEARFLTEEVADITEEQGRSTADAIERNRRLGIEDEV